ncbi:hypothetical protein CEXT_552861 [Caerostris extrusa]|uniref:Uncharacterized protein n=1 Tax=Caerostris extrusa TaxID=172846 RepID=A0AAV4QB33_CAEEX|nr:hypothetical protein CEXT_552861 [Caerostris extrusa]
MSSGWKGKMPSKSHYIYSKAEALSKFCRVLMCSKSLTDDFTLAKKYLKCRTSSEESVGNLLQFHKVPHPLFPQTAAAASRSYNSQIHSSEQQLAGTRTLAKSQEAACWPQEKDGMKKKY